MQLAQSLDTPTARSANTRVIRLRHNDAKTLAETLGQISEGMKNNGGQGGEQTGGGRPSNILIRADESTNALVLLADPDTVNALEDIVRQLDVPRAQVLVEAAIVEISGDIQDAVGVQWAINKGGMGGTKTNFANTGLSIGTLLQSLESNKAPESIPDGAIVGIGSSSFGALVTALSANTKSNLLSTPSLLTLDNQKAEILVGQNVPFQTGSYTTNSEGSSNPFTTVERKDIGVSLKVTPHINDGAALRLEIEQEISALLPNAQQRNNTDLITSKRSIKSTILAENGQVIVIGGLIQDDVSCRVEGSPARGHPIARSPVPFHQGHPHQAQPDGLPASYGGPRQRRSRRALGQEIQRHPGHRRHSRPGGTTQHPADQRQPVVRWTGRRSARTEDGITAPYRQGGLIRKRRCSFRNSAFSASPHQLSRGRSFSGSCRHRPGIPGR